MASYAVQNAHARDSYPRSYVAPPPPLRSAAARVRQQTLGPVFSEEEDGDDSEYIAARMREVELYGQNQNVTAAHMHQLQLQQQALALQQQYLLQQLLASQPQPTVNRGQPGSREAAARQQQFQQMQQLQLQAQMRQQQQVDPRIQAQLLSQLQASRGPLQQQADLRAQAMAAQAQLQAQVQARAQAKAKAKEEAQEAEDLKAKFEAQPNPRTPSKPLAEKTPNTRLPVVSSVEKTSPTLGTPKVPVGRFAQARQTATNPFGELTSLLARRSAEATTDTLPTTAKTSVVPSAAAANPTQSEDRLAARQGLSTLGLGRPAASSTQNRAKSSPFPLPAATTDNAAPRAVSLALKPIRQPYGPPAPTNELGDRNFQAMARKKAGKGLGMLGRRGEGSGATSPVVA